jgi:hypothetical protein
MDRDLLALVAVLLLSEQIHKKVGYQETRLENVRKLHPSTATAMFSKKENILGTRPEKLCQVLSHGFN